MPAKSWLDFSGCNLHKYGQLFSPPRYSRETLNNMAARKEPQNTAGSILSHVVNVFMMPAPVKRLSILLV